MSTLVLGHFPPLNFPYSQFLFVALAVLELEKSVDQAGLEIRGPCFSCLCLLCAGIKGTPHCALPPFVFSLIILVAWLVH